MKQQGSVWVADLEPTFRAEPGKVRPVLILQSDVLNRLSHPTTVVLPISSQPSTAEVLRIPITTSFLRTQSYLLVDQIRAIDNKRLLYRIGNVSQRTMVETLHAIHILLGM